VADFRYHQIIDEEIQAAGVGASGLGLTLHNDICVPYFLSYCTDEQKQRWLPGIASGELITAIGMTEPSIGSDLASMATTALRDGDEFVVNGQKTFITNGINADLVVLAVKTDPSQRHKGMSIIIMERAWPGSSAAATSTRSASTPRTPLSCSSPTSTSRPEPLGQRGRGLRHARGQPPQERLSIAIAGIAAARAAIDWTLAYVKSARRSASRWARSRTRASCWPRPRLR